MPDKFGLELLRLATDGADSSPSNAVIVITHWKMLTEGLRCAGTGETFSADTDISPPTEGLPSGWSGVGEEGVHCLKYRHKDTNEKFVLKSFATSTGEASSIGEQAHQTVIMMRVGDEKTAELSLKLSEETNKTTADKFKLTREDDLLKRIEEALIRPFFNKKTEKKEEKEKKDDDRDRDRRDPLREDPRRDPRGPDPRQPPRMPDFPDPFGPPGGGPYGPGGPGGPFGPGGGGPGPLWDDVPGLPRPSFGPRGGGGRGGFGGGMGGGNPFGGGGGFI